MTVNALKELANAGCNISIDNEIPSNALSDIATIIKGKATTLTVKADQFALAELKSVAALLGDHFNIIA